MRYWMLCPECHQNMKITTEGKQHPLWIAKADETDPKGFKLVNSGKTMWPSDERLLEGR